MEQDEDIGDQNRLVSRPYQVQLEEIAVQKNTIIHLPTGSGKTFIAIRLITRFRESLQKPWGQGGKRSFFLVNTVPLVTQQRKVIDALCPINGVAGYSGEDRVDYWNKTKWDEELTKYQVIVMTSQILSDMLTHSYVSVSDINLLILDECHHAVDDHPMRMVMKKFEDCPVEDQPRVVGLTATLLNANVSKVKIEETLKNLETTLHATIATVNELGEVLDYSTNPRESLQYYRPCEATNAANQAIQKLNKYSDSITTVVLPRVRGEAIAQLKKGQKDITTDPKKLVKSVKNMFEAMIRYIESMGVYGGSISVLAYIILLERLKRRAVIREIALFYDTAIAAADLALNILNTSMEKDVGLKKILKHSSEQILTLLDILKEYNPDNFNKPGVCLKVNRSREPLSGIIFTKERFTAKILFNLLKEVKTYNEKEFGFLKHEYVVGFNISPVHDTREQYYMKKQSQTAILKFTNKELNCLISTSVLEEGVDIPQCLLVCRYDPPLEYRSYIQGKGRARSCQSAFVMLVNSTEKSKFFRKYESFIETELLLRELLVGNTDERVAPTPEDLQEGLYGEDIIPPYVNEYGGRLSSAQAISLLNRYCSILPHDQFTTITPLWILEHVGGDEFNLKKIIIRLPLGCPIKEPIEGEMFQTLKDAKRSAALNACVRLYHEGELDQVTMLPVNYGKVDFELPDVRACFPNWPWDRDEDSGANHKAGTKKRVRKHEKVYPSCLSGPSKIKTSQVFYLHILQFKTAFDKPADPREAELFKLLQMNESYGFITANPLPKICKFPTYLTVGEVETTLLVNYGSVRLNTKMFELMKGFHLFIYDQVLDVAKKFLVFDGTENCLYTVPIIKEQEQYNIDWDIMKTYKEIPELTVPSDQERKSIFVNPDCYKHAVVSPWYRNNLMPDRYIVTNVLEYLTTQSPFATDAFETYAEYYESRYNLELYGRKDQPLLEVRNINTGMNCLLPRPATLNTLTDKQKKLLAIVEGDTRSKTFQEIFIPEFCVKFDFPGVYWFKALMLPSIVHRIHMLLIAEELRATIAKEAGIGRVQLRDNESWQPIEMFLHVATKSVLSQIETETEPNTVDRMNDPPVVNSPTRARQSMQETIYELQKKKINKDYPWEEAVEPIDIERNILKATIMDIECYDEFVNAPMFVAQSAARIGTSSSNPRSPRWNANAAPAILPPPQKYNEKIALLSFGRIPSHGPELKHVLAALTTINSHDIFNLERGETLGDSFLKFAATLYLFHRFPRLNEGQLTNIKGRLIGNRNLYYAGERIKLGGRMKTEVLSPRRDYTVPGFCVPEELRNFLLEKQIRPTFLFGFEFDISERLSGKVTPESFAKFQNRYTDGSASVEDEPKDGVQQPLQAYVRAQAVSDKSVADCVEALIGTYLLSCGIPGAVRLLEWLRVIPPEDNFADYLHKKVPTVLSEGKKTTKDIDYLLNHCQYDIEKIIGYKFNDPTFLLEALSHASFIRNNLTRSYERLEFLGDAILDFLITSYIFENSRDLKPGDLTDLRSALVNNVTFASYVVKLGLHKFLCSELNPVLDKAIMSFVEHQEQRNHEIVEDVLYRIDEEDCRVAEYVEVPKALSDIFESLAGAIFLDSGGDLQAVWGVYYRIMWREIDAFSANIPLQPVRVLHEMIHACPVIGKPMLTKEEIPNVMIPVTVTKNGVQSTVYGFGKNKFQAKRAAAKTNPYKGDGY